MVFGKLQTDSDSKSVSVAVEKPGKLQEPVDVDFVFADPNPLMELIPQISLTQTQMKQTLVTPSHNWLGFTLSIN